MQRALPLLLMCALATGTSAEPLAPPTPPQPVPEYHLKLAYLYNFAKFVQWPSGAMGEEDQPIVVGLLDPTPFNGSLDDMKGKKAQGRPVHFRHCRMIEEMQSCHVLFLNTDDDLLAKRILTALRERPVLTVGEREPFVRWGGVVRFFMVDGTVRLEANVEAARVAHLTLSAQLLEVSRLVKPVEER